MINFKIIFLIGAFLFSFALVDTAYAQLGIGQPATIRGIDVTIEELDNVHVVHEVVKSSSPNSVQLIEGTISNIEVVDEEGNEVQHGVSGGFGGNTVTLFPRSQDVFVKYDVSDVMFSKHGTTWTWHFLYLATTTFHLPDSVDLAFVNDRPVYFTNERTFNCHGCEMVLEFIPNEKKTIEKVTWEGQEFDVQIWASTELSSFNFDQPTKSISYDFDDTERWVTLIIPLELLWNPYQAWMGDEKIFTHEFKVDDEHYGVSLKLAEAGNVSIVGTSVIPEFPMIVPIMLVAITMVILLQSRSRFSLR